MRVGDPPLRWSVEWKEQRSLSAQTNNWSRRMGIRVKTFYYGGQMWVVRPSFSPGTARPGPILVLDRATSEWTSLLGVKGDMSKGDMSVQD